MFGLSAVNFQLSQFVHPRQTRIARCRPYKRLCPLSLSFALSSSDFSNISTAFRPSVYAQPRHFCCPTRCRSHWTAAAVSFPLTIQSYYYNAEPPKNFR